MSLLRSLLGARSGCSSLYKRSAPLGILGVSATLTFTHLYVTSSPLYAESNNSRSSTLFRQASPSAPRKPSGQLVFLSRNEERRKDWANWYGYFREAGYDCIDMNIALADIQADKGVWTDELTSQLRLLSLQRPPLIFAFHAKGSEVALGQVQSKDPRMSGLVIVVPSSDLEKVEEQLAGLDKDKLRIFVVDESQGKDAAFQQVERWMSAQGLA